MRSPKWRPSLKLSRLRICNTKLSCSLDLKKNMLIMRPLIKDSKLKMRTWELFYSTWNTNRPNFNRWRPKNYKSWLKRYKIWIMRMSFSESSINKIKKGYTLPTMDFNKFKRGTFSFKESFWDKGRSMRVSGTKSNQNSRITSR